MKKILLTMMAVFALMSCAQKNPAQVSALLDRIGGEGTSARIETQVKKSLSKDGKDVFYNHNYMLFSLMLMEVAI